MKIELNDLYFHELAIENGYVKAPAPATPQQTEAERLVGIATGLPDEVWAAMGWDTLSRLDTDSDGDILRYGTYYGHKEFRTILLGVMAAYVGTEQYACVQKLSNGLSQWCLLSGTSEKFSDILTAYAACCKAIAERRKGAGNA